MRFHHSFDDILGSPVGLRVLRILSLSSRPGHTGRELSREVGSSPSQTIIALERLESSGVVEKEVVGPSHLWKLSESHALTGLLRSLFAKEASLLKSLQDDLREALEGLPVERAWLFGSVARGTERPTSDLDLFVIVRSKSEKKIVEESLSALSSKFALKFGNPLSTLVAEGVRSPSIPTTLVEKIRSDGLEIEV